MPDRSDIRDYARELTLVESDDWSDAKVNALINQGIRELSTLYDWPYLEAEDTISLLADQDEYSLPSDFSDLIEVIGDGGEELTETTRRRAQRKYLGNDGGTPEEFYFFKEKIYFVPTPSSPSFSTVVIDYHRTPTTLNNDVDVPEFHETFHLIIADYAAAKIWEREEDFHRSNFYMGKFYDGGLRMMNHYRNRSQDAPLIVGGGDPQGEGDPQRPFMTWPHMS